jgi:hypothetical protein
MAHLPSSQKLTFYHCFAWLIFRPRRNSPFITVLQASIYGSFKSSPLSLRAARGLKKIAGGQSANVLASVAR